MRMRMGVVAAVPRARAIMATAGVLWALPIVMADGRIDTDPVFAGSAMIAIVIAAALGADIGRLAVAADEPVAAIGLWAGVSQGDHTAGFPDAPAAVVFRDAFVSATAGLTERADERLAGAIVTADIALRAIRIAAALGIRALSDVVADRATEAVVIGTALGAIRAFIAVTTAELTLGAVGNDGAHVGDAVDARAEGRRIRDAVTDVTALATGNPGTAAADPIIQVDAHAAFAFLAGCAGADAGAAVADVAPFAVGVIAALRADAAGAAVRITVRGIGTEKLVRTHTLLAGRRFAFVIERAVIEHSLRRTGCALSAGAVEARCGDRDANRSPEESLDRRTSRGSPRECPGQGIKSSIVHEPFTPFPAACRKNACITSCTGGVQAPYLHPI